MKNDSRVEEDGALDILPDWYYASSRPEMISFVPRTSRRILDIGCAEGRFGARIKEELGAQVWGIEYDRAAAAAASTRLDRVIQGDALSLIRQLDDASFDCITALDVLEHLVDPFRLLAELKRLLRDNGCLIISVPNVLYISNLFRLLVKKDWEYVSHGVLDRTHLRFFTKKSLLRVLKENRYVIDRFEGMFPIKGILFPVFNLMTVGHLGESRYLQFGVRVRST